MKIRNTRRLGASGRQQRGFSLTEVAVALSVAGLLIGGVLKGVEMMEQARTLKSGKLLEETAIGHQLFVDKYQFMPGDLPGADQLIANSLVNGNGDNILTVTANDPANDGWTVEAYHYWAHLAAAGMGPSTSGANKQDATPAALNASGAVSDKNFESIVEGAHFPAFPLGGYMQVVSGATAREGAVNDGRAITSADSTGTLAFPEIRLNELYYRIGHGDGVITTTENGVLSIGGQQNKTTAVNQVDLWRLDAKFDDGRPASGRIMTTTNNCRSSNSAGVYGDGSADQYVYNSNSASCLVLYRAANTGGSVAITNPG